jgi:uncharacterized protein (TIGR04255 family)
MPHYNRAPITEALIDIRVEPSTPLKLEDFHPLKARLPDYPKEETRNLNAVTIQFGAGISQTTAQQPWALVLRNAENNQVVQFSLNGFTFSRLEPYQDWEHLRDETKRLWDIYAGLAKPKNITRIAVRFINVFKFPGERVEPDEYLNIFPEVSRGLRPELRDFGPFSMRLPFPQQDLKGVLVINQGNGIPQPGAGIIPIILDLDLFVDNPVVANEEELWSLFEKLRVRKNEYFEASITDKTRELIR